MARTGVGRLLVGSDASHDLARDRRQRGRHGLHLVRRATRGPMARTALRSQCSQAPTFGGRAGGRVVLTLPFRWGAPAARGPGYVRPMVGREAAPGDVLTTWDNDAARTELRVHQRSPGPLARAPARGGFAVNVLTTPVETLPRADLERLQLERLRALVSRAARVPLHRDRLVAAGMGPDRIRALDDLRRLPFTTKADFRDTYPFGLLAVPMDQVVRIHASSGTTGKATVVAYTRGDLDVWTEVMGRTLRAGGVGPGDVVQNAYGYGLFTGGLGFHYGAEFVGAAVIPVSGGFTDRQLVAFQDLGSTVLCCTPSYALHLAEAIEEAGLSVEALRLRVGFFGAEPWTEAMRTAIEKRLRLMALNIYGLSEITGPGVAVECSERRGMHVAEDHFLPEVVDPETLQPVPRHDGRARAHDPQQGGHAAPPVPHARPHVLDPPRAAAGARWSGSTHHGAVRRHADHPWRQRVPLAGGARAAPGAGARAARPPGGAARARPRHPGGRGADPAGAPPAEGAAAATARRPPPPRRAPGCRSRSGSWRRRRSSGAPARRSASSTSGGRRGRAGRSAGRGRPVVEEPVDRLGGDGPAGAPGPAAGRAEEIESLGGVLSRELLADGRRRHPRLGEAQGGVEGRIVPADDQVRQEGRRRRGGVGRRAEDGAGTIGRPSTCRAPRSVRSSRAQSSS